MIHVFHVLPTLGIGGAERLLLSLIALRDAQRVRYTLLLPEGSRTAKAALLGARVLLYRGKLTLPLLLGVLRREKPDVIHTHGTLLPRIAGRLFGGASLINSKHCALLPPQQPRLYRALTDVTVATGEDCRSLLLRAGIPEGEITLIPNTPPPPRTVSFAERERLRAHYGLGQKDFAVGLCGRLVPVKGHKTLLLAAKRLSSLPFRFFFLGDGEKKGELLRQIQDSRLSHKVTLLGAWEDPAPFFGMLDAAVNCSLGSETASLALSEGMALGLPTAASNIPGNRQTLKNGGIFFPPGNAEALARALLCLRAERERYSRMAREAYAQRPSAESMCRAYEELYLSAQSARLEKRICESL